jgi:hypothetical protein
VEYPRAQLKLLSAYLSISQTPFGLCAAVWELLDVQYDSCEYTELWRDSNIQHDDAHKGDVYMDSIQHDDAQKDDVYMDSIQNDDAHKDNVYMDRIQHDDAHKDDVYMDNIQHDDAHKDDVYMDNI